MIKNKLSIYFIFISLFTVITIFTSIVQKSYSNLIGPSQETNADQLLNKINPNLDTSVIDDIKNRPESLDTGEFNFVPSDISPTPTTTDDLNPESSASSEINQILE